MKKVALLLIIIMLFSFTPGKTSKDSIENSNDLASSPAVAEEIEIFNNIIKEKLKIAAELESRASLLFEKDDNSNEEQSLLIEARLQKTMALKYEAAIACRMNFKQ